MRILIVEQDSAVASVLRRMLEKLGHDVAVADSGAAAETALESEAFSVIFCAWVLPDCDGPELCRRVRARKGASPYFCLLASARQGKSDVQAGGSDDVLPARPAAWQVAARLRGASRFASLQDALARQQEDAAQHSERLSETMAYVSAANRRFSELFEGLPVACYSLDGDGHVHEWNRAATTLFGHGSHETLSRPLWPLLFAPEDADRLREQQTLLRQAMAGEALPEWEWHARTKTGDVRRLLSRALPVRASTDDGISGVICAHVDITERDALKRDLEAQGQALAHANARLEEMVTLDGLTGLKNHRFFREALNKAYSFAARHRLPLSLIMLDVDHFKSYNDAFGHPEGDVVLRLVGQILRDSTRDHDCCARYGGEEFAVLLPATDARGAVRVAERLRGALEESEEGRRPVTASVGVATLHPSTQGADGLLQEADQSLYRSKAGGRNRVTHALDPVSKSAHPPAETAGFCR